MKKLSWKFYFARTNKTLKDFLFDTRSIEEAKSKLSKKGLTLPDDDLILSTQQEILNEKLEKKKVEEEALKPKAQPTTPRRKDSPRPKKTKPDQKNKDEKYFRKVVPTKKS